ncbi:MAG: hypothetical protein BWY77_00238 [bacterium ADurb.Bin431]|nr:MAG: hypothetical protein BWY77_00238 [bacterium ADurb.Bin431]
MEGLFRVFAQKNDADQIEAAADVVFRIDRLVETARQLFDLALGDAVALALRQHGQKGIEGAVVGDVVEHLAPQGQDPAVDVVEVEAGHAVGQTVKSARDDPVQPRVTAGVAHPDNDILPGIDLLQQGEGIGGFDAHPAGEVEQDLSCGDLHPGVERRGLAKGRAQPCRLDPGLAAADAEQLLPGGVGAAVIHIDEFMRLPPLRQRSHDLTVHAGDLPGIVVGQDDDRKGGRCPYRGEGLLQVLGFCHIRPLIE